MQELKQSTTITIQMGPALDKTDGVTEEEALSPTVYVSKNGAAFAVRSSATAITHDRDGWYLVELDTTDTGTLGRLDVFFQDPTTHLPVWREFSVVSANYWDTKYGTDKFDINVAEMANNILNAAALAADAATEIADAAAVRTGTAQAGAATTITLDAGAVATDDYYNDQIIHLTGGTGAGQSAIISDYVGSTKVATVNRTWATNPDATTTFKITPFGSVPGTPAPTAAQVADAVLQESVDDHKATANSLAEHIDAIQTDIVAVRTGTAQAGAASTITLDAGAVATDDYYNDLIIQLTGGTGAGQGAIISDYVGATKVATVNRTWATNPDATTTFKITAFGSVPGTPAPTAAQVADAVLQESVDDHKATANSLAEHIDAIQTDIVAVRTGTAQAGAASTITLDAGAVATDDYYNDLIIQLTGGTGAGQGAIISDYVGATKVATVNRTWATNPDATTTFKILAFGSVPGASAPTAAQVADAVLQESVDDHKGTANSLAEHIDAIQTDIVAVRTGTAQAGAGSTITLDAGAVATDDYYNDQIIHLTGGTGAGQSAIISDYVGATKVATVNRTWATNPDATTTFKIVAFGSVPGASAPTAAQVADAVWNELTSGHRTAGTFGLALQLCRAIFANKRIVYHAEANKLEVYDDDDVTVLRTLTPTLDVANNKTTYTPS